MIATSPCRNNLDSYQTLVIKVGSAVLTNDDGLDFSVIASLASQIASIKTQGRKIILVSSGAVAAGRAAMANNGTPIKKTDQTAKQALAAIGQARLMHAWNEAFRPMEVITGQALLTRDDFRVRERFQHAANTFSEMFSWDVLPIVNENDTVAVHELKFGDNDTLASLLVNLVQADLFINLTSAPGVFASNPAENPETPVLEVIPDISKLEIADLCGPATSSGSGGMHSKLLAARRVAQLGVPTLILPGRKPGILLRAFAHEKAASKEGTWICPADKTISRRKFWLAYQSEPEGAVEIDDGAAEALLRDGRSLLPGGIKAVKGNFGKGALIRIEHQGRTIGVGFGNYESSEISRIHGLKRHEIAAILGNANYPDVVHRDNLLLDAALNDF